MACKPALKKAPDGKESDFASVFSELRKILVPYAGKFRIVHDTPENFYLETAGPVYKGKPVMFGAVRAGRAYVSFHLFPLYMNPSLVAKLSPQLKQRMQGKTCFNFTKPDAVLFAELASLTAISLPVFMEMGAKLQKMKSVSTRKK